MTEADTLYLWKQRLHGWLYNELAQTPDQATAPAHVSPWWMVMCLTGVDYFSTLAYQPSIAFLAAGSLAPIATLVLVLLTLFGALPVYRRVAAASPYGQGSILMLESLFPRWKGKLVVLCLLGFAATSFVITITLSAADAAAHLIDNPLAPDWVNHPVMVTLVLLCLLGAVFLKGFGEAIALSVALVLAYLGLNVIVIAEGLFELLRRPSILRGWMQGLLHAHGTPASLGVMALLLFPKLALGLSGFETGVAVMPLVKGDPADTEEQPLGRIRNTEKLLRAAALIMSVLLLTSSLVTTALIPPEALRSGGLADGRALAYLAHERFGSAFGTLYDVSTVLILWFAGASAVAGLLNLVPRYLPRYGMAPEWARANRPLVIIITAIGVTITLFFNADVNAQGGAYATGVLVLITSAALAAAISAVRKSSYAVPYVVIAVIFIYTTATNMVSRPEGVKIAVLFIAGVIVTSLVSRTLRSTELRVLGIRPDAQSRRFFEAMTPGRPIRIIATRPGHGQLRVYDNKLAEARDSHHLPADDPVLFLEVLPGDASQFSHQLDVEGTLVGPYRVLRCQSAAVPNAIAALLLYIRDQTGTLPHVYFGWTEGNPITYMLKFLAFGEGDTAPVAREVLRQAEKNPARRPRVHVG